MELHRAFNLKIQHTKHITLDITKQGMVAIDIDDCELLDYVDDYLTEDCNISYEFMNELSIDGSIIYRMSFHQKYQFEEITNLIQKLDKDEINRIYAISNPSIRADSESSSE